MRDEILPQSKTNLGWMRSRELQNDVHVYKCRKLSCFDKRLHPHEDSSADCIWNFPASQSPGSSVQLPTLPKRSVTSLRHVVWNQATLTFSKNAVALRYRCQVWTFRLSRFELLTAKQKVHQRHGTAQAELSKRALAGISDQPGLVSERLRPRQDKANSGLCQLGRRPRV